MNADDIALGFDSASIRRDFAAKLFFELAKFPGVATCNDHYLALAYVVRDRVLQRWVRSARTFLEQEHRTVIYLSAEYLMGPQLGHNLMNLGIEQPVRDAMQRARARPRRTHRARRRTRPRQRRPRATGRLLHGFARDARLARDRARHPLRVRHLRPGDPRRLAGREDRHVAASRAFRGRSDATGSNTPSDSAGGPSTRSTTRGSTVRAGSPSAW